MEEEIEGWKYLEIRLNPLSCGMGILNATAENGSLSSPHPRRLSNLGALLLEEETYMVWLHGCAVGQLQVNHSTS